MAILNVPVTQANREFNAFIKKYIGVLKVEDLDQFVTQATADLTKMKREKQDRERKIASLVAKDKWGYHLPDELLLRILTFVPTVKDAIKASLVCRTWYTAIGYGKKSEHFWKMLYLRQWKEAPTLSPVRPPSADERALQLSWFERCIRRERVSQNWEHGVYDRKVLIGHTADVTRVQFDSKRILTSSLDGTLRVWDPQSTECIAILRGHTDGVWTCQFDSTRIVSASADATIKVWDSATFAELDTLTGHTNYVSCLEFDDTCIVSGSWDTTLRVWGLDGQYHSTLRGHTAEVNCLQLRGNTVVSGSSDGTLKEWSIQAASCVQTYTEEAMPRIDCVQFNDTHIFSGGGDQVIRVWSRESQCCVKRLMGHTQHLNWLQLDPTRLVSASYDNTIRLWNLDSWEVHEVATYHYGWDIWHFQATEEQVVVASLDRQEVEVWDFATRRKFLPIEESDFRPSRHPSRQTSRAATTDAHKRALQSAPARHELPQT